MTDNRPLTWYYWRPGVEDKWCFWLETDTPPIAPSCIDTLAEIVGGSWWTMCTVLFDEGPITFVSAMRYYAP